MKRIPVLKIVCLYGRAAVGSWCYLGARAAAEVSASSSKLSTISPVLIILTSPPTSRRMSVTLM